MEPDPTGLVALEEEMRTQTRGTQGGPWEDSDLRTSTSGLPRRLHDNISRVSFTLFLCRMLSPGVSAEMRLGVQRGRGALLHTLALSGPG